MTLTFGLLIPKIEAFILVPKCINAEFGEIQSSNFQDKTLTSAFSNTLEPSVTANFDLLLAAFILVPKCTSAESLAKIEEEEEEEFIFHIITNNMQCSYYKLI